MNPEIITLNLVSPLYYLNDEKADPFGWQEGNGETLFCFDLDPAQSVSIEPDESRLLSALIFGGRAATDGEAANRPRKGQLQLPAGKYLFAQARELLSREEITGLAAEVQKEGLWQRLSPGGQLYLRYLFEDGRGVTQIFRPISL
jgi:hypothetical protein